MAGKNQQVPRAVPSTLLEVHFVQRERKLYKVLLPTSLKNKNSAQPPATPIVFEARNVRSSKKRSNEPSPFLKPVTLTPTEYKAIPFFKRGERIVDANWPPEETECLINLLKNNKAFQDSSADCSENLLPKIVSVTSNDVTVLNEASENVSVVYKKLPSEVSPSQILDDVSQMTNEEVNSDPTSVSNSEKEVSDKDLETVTPTSEVKLEHMPSSKVKPSCYAASKSLAPLNGENCINADIKSRMKSILRKRTRKIPNVRNNNNTNCLTPSPKTDLPDSEKCVTSLIEKSSSTNKESTKLSSKDNSVTPVENSKAVQPIDTTLEETTIGSSSDEEQTLFERLKNAKVVKVEADKSSVLKEQTNSATQQTLEDVSIKESAPPSPKAGVENRKPHDSSSQNEVGPQETIEDNVNISSVTAAVALIDHDYASSYPYFPNTKKRTVGNYELRVFPKPKSHPDARANFDSNKTAKSTFARPRGRKPTVTVQGLHQNQVSINKSSAPFAVDNILPIHCQKFVGGKLQSLPATSVVAKQNSPTVVKGVIKFLMPRSFSNNCSEKDTAQALNRLEKFNAVNGLVQTNTLPLKYSTPPVPSNANVVFSTADGDTSKGPSSAKDKVSFTNEEFFKILEPEVIIYESKDTFILQDGKLKLCPSKKPVRKRKNSRKSQKHRRKPNAKPLNSKPPNEIKLVTEDAQNKVLDEEKETLDNANKGVSSSVSKRTVDDVASFQNTTYQREILLPPAPKVRKLFISRSEKTASSLLQSCFVWLDKMDEQYLEDGRLDTTEVPEDLLFGIRDASHPYSKSQQSHNHYVSKASHPNNNQILIVESPPSISKDVKSKGSEQIGDFAAKIIQERKEANNRMADVLRLLEEKRKAIEALRQKTKSNAINQ